MRSIIGRNFFVHPIYTNDDCVLDFFTSTKFWCFKKYVRAPKPHVTKIGCKYKYFLHYKKNTQKSNLTVHQKFKKNIYQKCSRQNSIYVGYACCRLPNAHKVVVLKKWNSVPWRHVQGIEEIERLKWQPANPEEHDDYRQHFCDLKEKENNHSVFFSKHHCCLDRECVKSWWDIPKPQCGNTSSGYKQASIVLPFSYFFLIVIHVMSEFVIRMLHLYYLHCYDWVAM